MCILCILYVFKAHTFCLLPPSVTLLKRIFKLCLNMCSANQWPYQVIPGNDQNTIPTNQGATGSKLDRTS